MNRTVLYTESSSVENAMITMIDKSGTVYSHLIKNHISIGRASAGSSCELQLASPIVSKKHGEIFIADGKFYYRDLESTNGTYINNKHYGVKSGEMICQLLFMKCR